MCWEIKPCREWPSQTFSSLELVELELKLVSKLQHQLCSNLCNCFQNMLCCWIILYEKLKLEASLFSVIWWICNAIKDSWRLLLLPLYFKSCFAVGVNLLYPGGFNWYFVDFILNWRYLICSAFDQQSPIDKWLLQLVECFYSWRSFCNILFLFLAKNIVLAGVKVSALILQEVFDYFSAFSCWVNQHLKFSVWPFDDCAVTTDYLCSDVLVMLWLLEDNVCLRVMTYFSV